MRHIKPFPPVHRRPAPEPEPPPTRTALLRRRARAAYARLRTIILVALGILLALAAMVLFDASKPPPQHLTQRDIDAAVTRAMASATPRPSYASQAFEVIRPSLVRIEATGQKVGDRSDLGVGAGVIVDTAGSVLTSLHVVRDASEIRVHFSDGSASAARIVATEPENDLAVLRPDPVPDDLVPATLTSSDAIRVGDEVFAVGDPFGISDSITAGVVSGLGRSFKSPSSGDTLSGLIQFDAAVNPGNSGGPLVTRDGEVAGIVTALLNPTQQNVFIGIGFAVPIESATSALGSPPY